MNGLPETWTPPHEAALSRENGGMATQSLFCKVARVRALKKGNGLRYLLNETAEILENPLLMFDADCKFIDCTENVITDDWVWNELATEGRMSYATLRFFRDENFIDEFSNVKTTALLVSDKLKYVRLLGRILSRDDIHVANLMMAAVRRPIGVFDPVVFEEVCGLCTREVRDMPELLEYGRHHQQSLIITLLSQRKLDRGMYVVEADGLYKGFESNLFVAVADAPRGIGREGLVRLREQLRRLEPGFKYAAYKGRIVILMSSREFALTVKKDLPRLGRFFEQKNIAVGVSGCFENVFELRRYYADALDELRWRHVVRG